jgi:hypothetical protein
LPRHFKPMPKTISQACPTRHQSRYRQ